MAEFLLGMAIAAIAAAGFTLPGWARVGLVLSALILLMTGHLLGIAASPPVMTGMPMAMLVAAAVLGQVVRVPRSLLVLGDASFALYLVHPFPMRAVGLILALAAPDGDGCGRRICRRVAACWRSPPPSPYMTWFERPVGTWLRTRLARPASSGAASPCSDLGRDPLPAIGQDY